MNKKTVEDIDVAGKRVLVRVDYNVPIENGVVGDLTRIEKSLPTINYLVDQGAKVILMSHLGRPEGEVVEEMRLTPVAKKVEELLGKPVKKLDDCVGEKVKKEVMAMKDGEIVMLENVRFYPGEEANDPEFTKQLAELGEVFVNDAFGTAHRAHASTAGLADYLPVVSGLLLEKEIDVLTEVMDKPKRPLVAIIGGAKISTKLGLIEKLLDKVDYLCLGGALANTIFLARGEQVGKSLVEEDVLEEAKKINPEDLKIQIPVDVVVAREPREGVATKVVGVASVGPEEMILDIGPDTINLFREVIDKAGTVIWNGPLGMFEVSPFAEGTKEIARAAAEARAKVVVGGGETVEALNQLGLEAKVDHVSTGGGAMLEFLEGKELPGVAALEDK